MGFMRTIERNRWLHSLDSIPEYPHPLPRQHPRTMGPSTRTCFLHTSPSSAIRPFLKNRPNTSLVPLFTVTLALMS